MKIGTKSLLFGVHQFIIHPLILALAWRRLYGFPCDPRLWACFILHDIGYWGMGDMDGPTEGQRHPELGAKVIRRLFGDDWGNFCLYHSRFYARAEGHNHSKLCVADKLAFCMYGPRFYIFLARLSGEMELYKSFSEDACEFANAVGMSDREWYHALKRYTLRVTVKTDRNYDNHVDVGLTSADRQTIKAHRHRPY